MLIHGKDANNFQVPLLLGVNGEVLLYGVDGLGNTVRPLLGSSGEVLIWGVNGSGAYKQPLLGANGELVTYGLNGAGTATKFLIDGDGRLVVTREGYQYGYISGAWQKQPIREGYSSIVRYSYLNTDLPAGTTTVSATTVPAGEIWVIENITIQYTGTVAGVQLHVWLTSGGNAFNIYSQVPPVSAQVYDRQGNWTLSPGDNLTGFVSGATLHDDLVFRYFGRTIDIDL